MKKRLIITEEEKRRILGLHKLLIFEQPISDPDAYAKFMEKNPNPQPTSNDTTDEPYYPDEYGRKIGKPKEFEKRTTTSAEGKKQLTVNDLYVLAGNDVDLKRLLDSFTGQYEDATKLMLKSLQGETLTPEEEQTMNSYIFDVNYDEGTSDNFKTGMYDKLKKLYSTSSSQATTNSGTNSSAQIKFPKDKLDTIKSLPTESNPYACVINHPYMSKQTRTGGDTEFLWGSLKFKLNGKYYVDSNPNELLTYYCDGKIVQTEKHGPIKPTMSQRITPPDQQKPEETIVKDFDRAWDYKKSGEDVFVKRKNTEKWIKVGGETKSSILSQVFKDTKACVYPAGELCPGYDGKKWSDSKNTENDAFETQIGFCSKKYCTVKYIQDGLNDIIDFSNSPLKGFNKIKVDGKFGKDTQNLVYALIGKVTITGKQLYDKYTELKK